MVPDLHVNIKIINISSKVNQMATLKQQGVYWDALDNIETVWQNEVKNCDNWTLTSSLHIYILINNCLPYNITFESNFCRYNFVLIPRVIYCFLSTTINIFSILGFL